MIKINTCIIDNQYNVSNTPASSSSSSVNFDSIPDELKDYDQWILWKLTPEKKKIPFATTNIRNSADYTNPKTWSSFDEARDVYEKNASKFSGIGFVFTESDPFVGIDYDHARDNSSGFWDPEALQEIMSLNTYAEISPSGTGAHAIIKGRKNPKGKNKGNNREIYDHNRYFTVTGNLISDVPNTINEDNGALKLIQEKVGYKIDTSVSKAPVATKEQIDKPINSEDQLILNRCRRAKNNENFMNLWNGNNLSRYKTQSEAEMALTDIFAHHTKNKEQIKRLVGMAALSRAKWDREDYTARTIEKALEYTNDDNSWNGIPIPTDYEVDKDGIFKRSWDSKKKDYSYNLICYTPVAISGIGQDIDRNEFWYKITFVTSLGETRHEYVKQEDLTKKANVLNFANKGITIIEKQANDLCEYFAKSIHQCATKLPYQIFVSKSGWKKKPEGFVVGNRFYTDSGILEAIQIDEDETKGLTKRGTLDDWIEGVDGVISEPITRFKCYCMGAAVLLRPLGAQSFLVDHSGDTSKGKTFGFKVAVSLYGNPKELELSARSTSTYLEHQASTYNDLPLFVDETSLQTDDNLKDLIYMIANEVGKGRGTKDGGIQKLHRWKSVAFVTGEKPLIDSDGFGGQQVRVISLQSHMPTMKVEIERAEQALKNNYGHIIDLFMEKVFKYADGLDDKYRGHREIFTNNGSTTMDRMGNTFAVIALAGELLEEVFEDIGIETMDNVKLTQTLFQEAVKDKPIESYALRALRNFNGWIEANRNNFVVLGDNSLQTYKIYGYLENQYINVNSTVAKEALNSFKIKASSVKKDWIKWGVLETYSDGRDYRLDIGDNVPRVTVYRINIAQMQEVLEKGVV